MIKKKKKKKKKNNNKQSSCINMRFNQSISGGKLLQISQRELKCLTYRLIKTDDYVTHIVGLISD
mgnify:CR=1 FL=1